VWSSTFNARSLVARARKELPLESDPIGVAVLAMVDADAAGVMFTRNDDGRRHSDDHRGQPGSRRERCRRSRHPDNWIVDATHFAIVDRKIAPGQRGTRRASSRVASSTRRS